MAFSLEETLSITESAQRTPTIIEIAFSASSYDDESGSPYYGRTEPTFILSSTTKFSKSEMRHCHLGFPMTWEKFIFQKESKYITHCWLRPFMFVRLQISPFNLVVENLGDGQAGIYLKLARSTPPYRLTIRQEGKVDREAEEYIFERVRYAAAYVNEQQSVHIEEIAQEVP